MDWCDEMEEPRLLIAPVPCTSDLGKNITTTAGVKGNLISLRHPKTGTPTIYVFSEGLLQELNWFKQSYGSWFLADYVCGDGSLYIATVVDPVFIMLPIFDDARMKKGNDQGLFRQLDEILYVDGYSCYQHLKSIAENSMQLVSEVKEIGSSKYFRLDDSKVLVWLCHKVEQLKETLTNLDKNYGIQEEKETLKEIVSILGEYLKDEPWLTRLCSHLQIDIKEAHQRTHRDVIEATFLESTPVSSSFKGKTGNVKQRAASSGKQSKKMKTETDSKNIKDMFRRVTRSGT